jgi:diadenosine tetraphosphate (Ap4A) HIT family hydrolase
MADCIFCSLDRDVLAQNKLCYAIYDKFPVNPGHILIIPKRHINSLEEVTEDEFICIGHLIKLCKNVLEQNHPIDGYNIGININEAGGQSIPHLHVHMIPRYIGDCEIVRGGIRNILPHECHTKCEE